MLQIVLLLFTTFFLAACGGDSGTSLDDLNTTSQSPILLQDLHYNVDEDQILTDTISYQNESLLQAIPTVEISIDTLNGSIQLVDSVTGTFSYTPNPNFNGVDEFTYIVTGPLGKLYTGTASITILPVNDAPVLTTFGSLSIIGGTLNQPTAVVSDLENDTTILFLDSAPDWVSADGLTLLLLPPVSLIGSDQGITLHVEETDSSLSSNTVTFTASIEPNSVGFSSANQATTEQNGQVLVPIELANASLEAITLNVTVAGGSALEGIDYSIPSTVTFDEGVKSTTIPVTLINDSVYEQTETIDLSIPADQSINVTQAATIISIADDDPAPVLSFNPITGTEGEILTVNFLVSKAINYDITANIANTSRLFFSENSFIIPANTLSKDIQLTLLENMMDEPDQTVQVVLSSLTNATTEQTLSITILDNDSPSTVTFNGTTADIIEGNTGYIVFTLDHASGYDISIPITLSGTVDQTDHDFITSSILIAKGEVQTTLPLSILDDTHAEGLETIILNAEAGARYQLANMDTMFNIIDNEGVFGVSQFGTGIWLDTETKGTWGETVWK